MNQTTLTVKIDKKLRDDAKRLADSLGIPLTTAVQVKLREFVRERNLVIEEECPFPSHTPNAETRRAIAEMRSGKGIEIFESVDAWEKEMRHKLKTR